MKKLYRVEVEWEDSTILRNGWLDIAETLKDRTAVRVTSVGFVLADDDQGIALAASVHGPEAAGVTLIPKSAIRKRRRLQ